MFNATLRISVFAQTTGGNNHTLSGVELVVRNVDTSDILAEIADSTVVWHDGISVSYDNDDHTLVIEKPADATCKNFDTIVGSKIAGARHKLAITRPSNKDDFDRETELVVTANEIDAILSLANGYADDALTGSGDDALGKMLGLTETDFGAADLFTEAFPLDFMDQATAAQFA